MKRSAYAHKRDQERKRGSDGSAYFFGTEKVERKGGEVGGDTHSRDGGRKATGAPQGIYRKEGSANESQSSPACGQGRLMDRVLLLLHFRLGSDAGPFGRRRIETISCWSQRKRAPSFGRVVWRWYIFSFNVSSKCVPVGKMMTASSCDEGVMRSWKDLVKVNGSFYCNLSLKGTDPELETSPPPSPAQPSKTDVFHHSTPEWTMTPQEPIYVNSHSNASVHLSGGTNRTILRIGEEDELTPVELAAASSASPCHTIKLVIGEPLSLDTSEYVSWDGSQTEAQSAADEDDIRDDDDEEEDEEEEADSSDDSDDSGADEEGQLPADSLPPPLSPTSPLRPADDELTHSCCRFFDQRQQKLSVSFVSATTWDQRTSSPEAAPPVGQSPIPGLNAKMEHLRREMVSFISSRSFCRHELLGLETSSSRMTFSRNPYTHRMWVNGSTLVSVLFPCARSFVSFSCFHQSRKPRNPILRRNR